MTSPTPDAVFGPAKVVELPPDDSQPYISKHGTVCEVDARDIVVMAYKMTGVCSELCRKRRDNEITESQYQDQKLKEA